MSSNGTYLSSMASAKSSSLICRYSSRSCSLGMELILTHFGELIISFSCFFSDVVYLRLNLRLTSTSACWCVRHLYSFGSEPCDVTEKPLCAVFERSIDENAKCLFEFTNWQPGKNWCFSAQTALYLAVCVLIFAFSLSDSRSNTSFFSS